MRSPIGIIFAHLITGVVLGIFLGAVYFLFEPLREFSGRLVFLGSPLPVVFGVYLLFGVFLGVVMGFLVGVLNAVLRDRVNPRTFAILQFMWLAFVLVVILIVRYDTLDELKAIPGSAKTIWFTLLFVAMTAIGVGLSRLVSNRTSLTRGVAATAVVVAGVLVVVAVVSNGVAAKRAKQLPDIRTADANIPNIIMIVCDALRPDHLSVYGYARDTSPVMDRLAGEGVVFRNARAHGNRTIISMPAIFTSLYPSFNGAVGRGKIIRPLPESHTTLAQFLAANGYTAIGMMNNVYLKTGFGLDRGFDKVEYFNMGRYRLGLFKLLRQLRIIEVPRMMGTAHYDAREVTDKAIEWLGRVKDRPYFLYVHYMDTHHPYIPPAEFAGMFNPQAAKSNPMELFNRTVEELEEFRGGIIEMPADDVALLKDYYDATIRFTDTEIGRLLESAARFGDGDQPVVIITADHGDEFFEHGSVYHNNLVIEELIRVPLILWGPGRIAGEVAVDPLVRHIDIFPTIADLIDAAPPEAAMGTSLLPLINGDVDSFDVESIAEGDFCTGLTFQNWKIVRVDSTDSFRLYDLNNDPGEQVDLSASARYADTYADMKKRLDAYLEAARKVEQAWEREADEETIRQLKALGYL